MLVMGIIPDGAKPEKFRAPILCPFRAAEPNWADKTIWTGENLHVMHGIDPRVRR